MPAALLAGFLSKLSTDPVGTIVKTGRSLFGIMVSVIGLAWYNSWRNQLQGLKPRQIPIPGITKLQMGNAPDRPNPAPPSPVEPIDITGSLSDFSNVSSQPMPNMPGGKLVPTGHFVKWNRIDQGQDLQTNPGGSLLAIGNGIVIAVQNDPGGFGYGYPVVQYTSGPLKGRKVYYGHTHSLLRVGQHFKRGQAITKTGYGTPQEGNARTPGWAEIGFWPPGSMQAGAQIAPYLHHHVPVSHKRR